MENLDYKKENIERKQLKVKVKNCLLESERDFKELKDKELKDGEEKIKRKIEEVYRNTITGSNNDMDKFEQQEMKKIRPIKKYWFDRLIK